MVRRFENEKISEWSSGGDREACGDGEIHKPDGRSPELGGKWILSNVQGGNTDGIHRGHH